MTTTFPTVFSLVKSGNTAKFIYYTSGDLWYEVQGFKFPVPISDTGDAKFLPEDKAIYFMRWINKYLCENIKTNES